MKPPKVKLMITIPETNLSLNIEKQKQGILHHISLKEKSEDTLYTHAILPPSLYQYCLVFL